MGVEKIPIVGFGATEGPNSEKHCLDWLQLTWIRVIQQRREGQTASSAAVCHCWLAWSLSNKNPLDSLLLPQLWPGTVGICDHSGHSKVCLARQEETASRSLGWSRLGIRVSEIGIPDSQRGAFCGVN